MTETGRTSGQTDEHLLEAYGRSGDAGAFEALVARHADWVLALAARQLGDRQLAEDAAQAVFALLCTRARRWRPGANVAGWLFSTTRYTVLGMRRARALQRRHERAAMEVRRMTTPAKNPPETHPLAEQLDEAVARLPRRERVAVVLRFYRGMEFTAIAQAQGITEAAAQKRVNRGIQRLRGRLAGGGEAVSAALGAVAVMHHSGGITPAAICQTALAARSGVAVPARVGTAMKGALTLMAITKAKIAAVAAVGGLILLASTAAVVHQLAPAPKSPPALAAGPLAPPHPELPLAPRAAATARYLHSIITEAYQSRGRHDPKWEAPMADMLSEFEIRMVADKGFLDKADLQVKAARARRAGCTDAMLDLADAYSLDFAPVDGPDPKQDRAAVEGLQKQDYSPFLRAFALWNLAEVEERQKDLNQATTHRQAARQTLLDWLRNSPEDWQGDGFEMTFQMIWRYGPNFQMTDQAIRESDQFIDALGHIDTVEPWVKTFMRGAADLGRYLMLANAIREGHSAPGDPARLAAYEKSAWDNLVQADQISPGRHEPALELIDLCSVDSPDPRRQPRYWFDRAVKARFDDILIWGNFGTKLLPRWGGTPDQVVAFINECVQTQRFDTDVPYMASHMLRCLSEDLRNGQTADVRNLKPLGLFPLVRRMYEGYLNVENDPRKADQYRSELLAWCWVLDEPAAAREVWPAGKPFNPELTRHSEVQPIPNFTADEFAALMARGGPAGAVIDEAIKAEKAGDVAGSRALLSKASQQASNDAYTTAYADNRLVGGKWAQDYAAGQWVDLTFDEALAGWLPVQGNWKRVNAHTVEGVSNHDGLRLLLSMPVARRFELEMTINFVHSGKTRFFNAGLVFAHPSINPVLSRVMLLCRGDGSLFSWDSKSSLGRVCSVQVNQTAHLRVKELDGKAWVSVDGKEIFAGNWLADVNYWDKDQLAGLGGSYDKIEGAVIRFSDVRVRKLAE